MTRHICPFCYTEFTGFSQMCGGGFLDRDHPSGVRPIMVEFEADGRLGPNEEERLKQARETYGRMGR